MKKNIYIILGLGLLLFSCTKDFDEYNTDPNNPAKVTTASLLTTAQKAILDDTRDEWWGGRQSFVWAQYLSQRNYTEEDRYLIRQNVNNNYWNYLYMDLMDLAEIIRLNKDDATKEEVAVYGANANQIAVAMTLRAYVIQIMTDTWGNIPFSQAFNIGEYPHPAYDSQVSIYEALIKDLTDASNMIDETETAFTVGDIIYGGSASKWKKFANSLKLRIAIRMKNVPDSKWQTYFDEAVTAGVFESNGDNAIFSYIGTDPNNSPMYDAFRIQGRNDFSVTKQFLDILKGVNDTLNNKTNPFEGLLDPRLAAFISDVNVDKFGGGDPAKVPGIPYGMDNGHARAFRSVTPNFYNYLGIFNQPDAKLAYLTFAEVCFLLSERNNWDQGWYEKGVTASFDMWGSIANELYGWSGERFAKYQADAADYIAALPAATPDRVITQKYINGFLDGYEAWAEVRRTGYPSMLLRPGEITYKGDMFYTVEGSDTIPTPITFIPYADVDSIVPRVTYPYEEQTLNSTSYEAAAEDIGGDEHRTKLWWNK
jgi:hypothetical protein